MPWGKFLVAGMQMCCCLSVISQHTLVTVMVMVTVMMRVLATATVMTG